MSRWLALVGLVGCTSSPDLSRLPPPCADGFHPDPLGTMCLEGPSLDAGPPHDAGNDGASDAPIALDAGQDGGTDAGPITLMIAITRDEDDASWSNLGVNPPTNEALHDPDPFDFLEVSNDGYHGHSALRFPLALP